MSDADVETKFSILCEGLMDASQRDALLKALWGIDQAADLSNLLNLLAFKSGNG